MALFGLQLLRGVNSSIIVFVRGEPGPERDKLKAREYKVMAAILDEIETYM